MALLPLIGLGVSALGSVFTGISQRRRARELERQNVRPVATADPNLAYNRQLALQQSRSGLPSQVYNNQLNQIQQNLGTGLRFLGQRGNLATNVNAMVRGTNQSTANLNAMDAQARLQGEQNLMRANTALAEENRYLFNVNQLTPYMQNAQNIASLRRAGTQNIAGGFGMLGQGAMMGVFGNLGIGGGSASSIPQLTTSGVTPTGLRGLSGSLGFPTQLGARNPFM